MRFFKATNYKTVGVVFAERLSIIVGSVPPAPADYGVTIWAIFQIAGFGLGIATYDKADPL